MGPPTSSLYYHDQAKQQWVLEDQRQLDAAEGWLELGNHLEANEELENITAKNRAHPVLLEVRWRIGAHRIMRDPRLAEAPDGKFHLLWTSSLLYDPGFNSIDANLFQAGDRFYLFFKDERKRSLKKNLRYAVAMQ